MYIKADGGLSGVKKAWENLESKIGSLKGRKFYGTYCAEFREYRACVAMTDSDDPAVLGLDVGIISGGKYAEAKISDWPANIDKIPETFDKLAAEYEADNTRPGIEYYRSQRELILLLPVK
jgi:hypothetical protein